MLAAVAPTKEAMKKTGSQPVLETASTELLAEKHTAGEGALYMVLSVTGVAEGCGHTAALALQLRSL